MNRVNTTFDDEEWDVYSRAVRKVGREGYSESHKLRLAALDWARHVLSEEPE